MPRFTNPYPQFTDSNGNPVLSGTLSFFESGTNTLKTVYADSEENTPIANPMTLAADGSAPNVFYSGAARVKLVDSNGVQIFDRDPVGGESQLGNFSTWGPGFLYGLNDIVKAANGEFYISIVPNNQDNDPVINPNNNGFWENIRFIGVYNALSTYSAGDVVQTNDGKMWRSVAGDNIGNDPASDGGSNWLPVVDLESIIESFGVGVIDEQPIWPQTSLNNTTGVGAGTYRGTAANTDKPTAQDGVLYFGVMSSASAEYTQIYLPADSGETGAMYIRSSSGGTAANPTWSSWREVWHDGNLVKTTSATDTTEGRVLQVGDFGLGGEGVELTSADDLNNLTTSGFYYYNLVTGVPANPPDGVNFAVLTSEVGSTTGRAQTLTDRETGVIYKRTFLSGAWLPWRQIFDTGSPNTFTAEILGASTLSRQAPVSIYTRVPGSSFTTTIDAASYVIGDTIQFNKGQELGQWTIDSAQIFVYPDGNTDTSLSIPSGTSMAFTIYKRGDNAWELTVLG